MSFDYARPTTVREASTHLGVDGAVALGGGTDLMIGIRHRSVVPTVVVDLKHVSDIPDTIDEAGDQVRIGGRVTMSEITQNSRLRSDFGALVDAAEVVGSVQIRNRATLAGNICNASPAADTAPALLAYGAEVEIERRGARVVVPLSSFFVGPGRTVLERGDLVTAIILRPGPLPAGSAFARVTRRRGVDLATVNLACVVASDGSVRYGFGAVAPTPLFAESNVSNLETDDGWEQVLAHTSPISDVRAGAEYRRAMLRVHARRALERARAALEGANR